MDRTHDGKAFRMLTVIDEFTRESLAIHVNRKLKSDDVLQVLSVLFVEHGRRNIVDRVVFSLDDVQWRAFQDALDRPVGAKPHLARLIAEKSMLE